ncbi:carboxypeptidase-like regulatory domain-containing protein [Hymenobacter endophyticus]|uniref:Carboxypeptidase-like regulatory domain-containing protein n=1 Tax=Hymenobacter endophyticus TaxID=3076335 RepID=A0ABU3TJX3_9BACT|nr:carboxypeptidase-like regulatory domain-containing protein [Hymenobacter endophyticus]MDU0371674.1 carboxypeptidase-like regulatory domain-containing protein [Hymenobacter endophyticus]
MLAVLGLLVFSLTAHAQTTLTGTLTDAQRQPIPGALVEVQPLPGLEESAVAVTDEAGRFRVPLPFAADSVLLSARSLGFTEQTRRLRNLSQAVTLTLPDNPTPLREVVVQADAIRREGDTLSYRVSAFTEQKDRVLADVLKKMPGVEVEADGRILYEGRPIQKFYINGADLLESRYSQASNNLPAEAVQDVQVLKRHQPIAALRGVRQSEQASLNISLKKAVTATGQGRLGLGAAPVLWNANLAPMLFTPRQQLLDTYQTNNTGQDVAAEIKPLSLDDVQRLREPGFRKPDLTGIQELGQPPLPASRWLFNQVHLVSANHLVPFSKDANLRVNASYLTDEQLRRGSTRTRYTLPDGRAITLTEDKRNVLRPRQLSTDLAYIRNVKQYYLKNTLSFTGSWDEQTGLLTRSADAEPIRQQARNPFTSLSNRLGLVQPLRAGRMLQVNSVLTLAASPQRLTVEPGPLPAVLAEGLPYVRATQQARQRSLYTANSVALLGGVAHWRYTATAGFNQQVQGLRSDLIRQPAPETPADSLRNHLRAHQARYYLQPALEFKTDRWRLEAEAPLSYRTLRATDAPLAAVQRRRWLTLEPQVSGRYELSGLWHAKAGADLTTPAGSLEQLYYGYLLRDYRTLQRNAAPLTRQRIISSRLGFYYENPLTSWFYQATYNFSTTTRNQLLRSLVSPDGSLTTVAVARRTAAPSHTLAAQASKFISPWKTSVTLQLSGSASQLPVLLNNTLTTTRSRQSTARLRANASPVDWASLEYTGQLSLLRSQVGETAQPNTRLQEHRAGLALYPTERHQLLLDTEHFRSAGAGPAVRTFFLDATYRYTLPTARKLDVELKASNLLNARAYQYTYVSSFVLVQNEYELRPRQLLVSVRASF